MNLDDVRKRLEAREEQLSPYATRVAKCMGRSVPEPPSPVRTDFQRDRDRIIHTTSFRRLKHKSQVFIAPLGDHYVTRLTHTIEVSQIGRTIARALNLNEDLVEAIATGHDIGHTPFGHIGERVLDELLPGGFHHSRHSVRIVESLEKGGAGLNLTRDVVEGIRRHSKPQGRFLDPESVEGMSLEAQIVRLSDAVAYLNHDIADALRAGLLRLEDLPREAVEALGDRHSARVNTLVTDIVRTSWAATGLEPIPQGRKPFITMSDEVARVVTHLRDFMFDRIYLPLAETP
ncbi:MAG: deoxyguanosinetriphosphate triphosphohydrolase, partial [Chloroflexi bacterium]|nr:deoxyguanosinetriphosphate triphosphohydrolase [Chloroflexota bacterium]